MELSKVEKLLDKYLEAETTLQEEKLLQQYFASEKVPHHLEEYKALFGFFAKEKSAVYEKEIEYEPKQEKPYFKWISIAASVAVIACLFWFTQTNQHQYHSEQASTVDYDVAMKNTQDLLIMMTGAISDGTEQLKYLNELNTTKNQLINN